MATPLYLLSAVAEVNPGAEDERALSLTRGGGVVSSDATATVAGPTAGVQIKLGGVVASWISPPLAAVTISGTVTFNLWGLESAAQANTGFDVLVERLDNAGAVQSTISRSERGTELAGSAAVNNWTATPTSTALTVGDRIKVTVFGNDAGGNMGSGRTFTLTYNGTSAAANGDSYVQFNETVAVTRLGTLASTQADQTVVSAGTVANAITGTLAATQAAHTLSSTGAVAIACAAAITQAAQTLSSSGAVAVVGAAAITQAAHTLSSAGTVKIAGALASTQADQVLAPLAVVYFTMDEASGTRADGAGGGHDLSTIGTVSGVSGKIQNAAEITISDANGLVRIGDSAFCSLGLRTVSFWGWARVDDFDPSSSDHTIIWSMVKDNNGLPSIDYYIAFNTFGGNVLFLDSYGADGSEICYIEHSVHPTEGAYFFFLVSIDAGNQRGHFRINDTVESLDFFSDPASFTQIAPLYSFSIGSSVNFAAPTIAQNQINGSVDEVGFAYHVLSTQEGDYLYNSGSGRTYPFAHGTVSGGDITGSLAATQADQTVSSAGAVAIVGTLDAAQAGDALSSTGAVAIAGALASTQADQTLSSTGTVAIAGTLASTQADQTLSSSGTVAVAGTLSSTQADQSLAAAGTVVGGAARRRKRVIHLPLAPLPLPAVTGALTRTQAAQSLSSSGTVAIAGALASTQDDQTSGSVGAVAGIGALARIQHAHRLTSSGTVGIIGTLGVLPAGDTLAGVGAVATVGALARLQRGQRLTARGTVVGDVSDDLVLLGLEPEDEELLLLA